MSSVMHIGISNPEEKRKQILECAVDALQTLKDYEEYKKTRKEILIYRKNFVKVFKELAKEVKGFKELLPVLHEPKKKKETHSSSEEPKEIQEKAKRIIKTRKGKTNLDKLEQEIQDLRNKIASL